MAGQWLGMVNYNYKAAYEDCPEREIPFLTKEASGYANIRISGGGIQSHNPHPTLEKLATVNAAAVQRIRKLAALELDWDGYGGVPPTRQAIETTTLLLLTIQGLTHGQLENPFIAPLADGGLELEWELETGAELMLVIPPDGADVGYLLDEPTASGGVIQSEGTLPRDATLSELISRLAQ